MNLPERLISWAQNEENIDGHYLDHGRDCLEAAEVIRELAEALKLTQWGFMLRRCPVCAGWNMGPNGETDYEHTKTCPVRLALTKVQS